MKMFPVAVVLALSAWVNGELLHKYAGEVVGGEKICVCVHVIKGSDTSGL